MSCPARLLLPAAAAVLLGVSLGCDRTIHGIRKTAYVPTEAGLTLIYENPQNLRVAAPDQALARLQARVASSREELGGTLVQMSYTGLQGQVDNLCLSRNGGWAMVSANGKARIQILPEGFPDRVSQWAIGDTTARVIGRGTVDLPGLRLPPDFDRVGVWVEFRSPEGNRRRTLFLPRIGEAETLVHQGGRWICTNRLISRGFTDAPSVNPNESERMKRLMELHEIERQHPALLQREEPKSE
ncbi:MAG TPA: hypothetical protein PKL14_09385 [Holophaga sp.]|nr:hypothetical protein [Holophaga sp.]